MITVKHGGHQSRTVWTFWVRFETSPPTTITSPGSFGVSPSRYTFNGNPNNLSTWPSGKWLLGIENWSPCSDFFPHLVIPGRDHNAFVSYISRQYCLTQLFRLSSTNTISPNTWVPILKQSNVKFYMFISLLSVFSSTSNYTISVTIL